MKLRTATGLGLLLFMATMVGGPVGLSQAQAFSFTFTPINVPFAGVTFTEAFGINPLGQVVGFYFDSGGEHGFLDDQGVFTPINVPFAGVTFTAAFGINPLGQLVGVYNDSGGEHGFLATPVD